MKLPQLAIQNRPFFYVLLGIVLLAGIRSFVTMPKAEDPAMDLPLYTLVVVFPGAGPEYIEEFVVDPIEEEVSGLDDINEIRTEITAGLAVMKIESEFGLDYDEKYEEISRAINGKRNALPSGIYELQIKQYKPEDQTVIQQFAFVSTEASYAELFDIAEEMKSELDKLPDVKKSTILASPREEIQIHLNFQKITELGITLDQISKTLQAHNTQLPKGTIKSGNLSFNIHTSGTYTSIDEIKKTPLVSADNSLLYLEDFATVEHGYEEEKWLARFNGERAIFLTVNQKRDSNILQLSEQMHQVSSELRKSLPAHVKLENAFEQAPAVESRITSFIVNLLQGILLVGLIVWFFLGWRSGLVVMTAIPLSVIMGIGLLDIAGFSLQQISIAALVIALGLLVDNAIVVVENIRNRLQNGYSATRAAIYGTKEVGYAIVSSTLTTVLAFAPLALLDSGPGEYLRSLPLTVIFALTASLIIALSITPILSSSLLKGPSISGGKTGSSDLLGRLVRHYYRPVLLFALRKGWIVISMGIALFALSLLLFPSIGISFFPTADKNLLLVNIETPAGSNLDRTDRAVKYVEEVLDTSQYVQNYVSNTGHGNPQVYYNRVPEEYKESHGEVLVNFGEWDRNTFEQTLLQLRSAFQRYPDARITFRELKNGSPFEAPIEIQILGDNLNVMKRIAFDIESMVRSVPGTKDIKNPFAIVRSDLQVSIHKEKAAFYGLSPLEVDRTIQLASGGVEIDEVTLDRTGKKYPLILGLSNVERGINLFDVLSVVNQKGAFVPVKQVADIEFKPEYSEISHFNRTRSMAVTANVENSDDTKAITEEVITLLKRYPWPDGYTFHIGGEYETQQASFGNLGYLLALALLGIFGILVLQFRSLMQPLIIFSAIPLAVTGSFFALFLTGWSFSFFAFVGFISLVGIVVNNSIILLDFSNQLRRKGLETSEAIKIAAEKRFIPILLTTLTTILGLLPLTFSATSLWSPLGWTLIGGLLSSMLLTLLVVPILYMWFSPK